MPNYTLADCQRDASAAAAQYGVPANLVFSLAVRESSCRPSATGGSGEIGITQILPATFRGAGCAGNQFNPVADFTCTAKILAGYLQQYGSAALSLGAYNAGPGHVRKCADGSYSVPSSTVGYISDILTRAGLPLDKVVHGGGCAGEIAQPGTGGGQTGGGAGPGGGATATAGDISGTLELPQVRAMIIYGLALVLIIYAITRLK